MILVLLLAGVEKLVNFAIKSDEITQAGLFALAGKSLRLNMHTPELHLDVLFQDDHIRFEPVKNNDIFEPPLSDEREQANADYAKYGHSQPDCTLTVANPAELLNLIRHPEGNLPITGDYKILMQARELVAGFSPDFAAQLEPFIGVALASQLSLVISQLKSNFSHTAKNTFEDVSDWANDITGNGKPDPEVQAQVNDLHQQLLKLQSDVEREQAKLDAIKAQQANLQR